MEQSFIQKYLPRLQELQRDVAPYLDKNQYCQVEVGWVKSDCDDEYLRADIEFFDMSKSVGSREFSHRFYMTSDRATSENYIELQGAIAFVNRVIENEGWA